MEQELSSVNLVQTLNPDVIQCIFFFSLLVHGLFQMKILCKEMVRLFFFFL